MTLADSIHALGLRAVPSSLFVRIDRPSEFAPTVERSRFYALLAPLLDRLVHKAYTIALNGPSRRKPEDTNKA